MNTSLVERLRVLDDSELSSAGQLKSDTKVDQLTHCHHATRDLPGVGTGIPGTGSAAPVTRPRGL